MESWGFDRTRCSLRRFALERIAATGHPEDLARLAAIVPEAGPLAVPQIEVLVALARGLAAGATAAAQPENLVARLVSLLHLSLDLVVPTPAGMGALARDALLLRLAGCPASVVAQSLTRFIGTAEPSYAAAAFVQFLRRFSETWQAAEELSDDRVVAALSALIGFLEGIGSTTLAESVYTAVFPLIEPLCSAEFQGSAQARLATLAEPQTHDQQDASVPRLVTAVARVCSCYADRATIHKDLVHLVDFSNTQLKQLEGSAQFHSDNSPENLPLLKAASAAHLSVLASAVDRYVVGTDAVFGHVLRALSDPFDDQDEPRSTGQRAKPDGYAAVVCWLAAITARDDDLRLTQVLELLPGFLSSLDPHTAFKAAKAFVTDFIRFHRSEASRIKVLYTLTNNLSPEEYNLRDDDGEYAALRFVASLLSALVAVATAFDSPQLASLLVTVLGQKLGEINESVDIQIFETWALLVPHLTTTKFTEGLNNIAHIELNSKQNTRVLKAIEKTRVVIARAKLSDEMRHLYLDHLLNQIITKGGAADSATTRHLFAPLAELATNSPPVEDWSTIENFRNAWFNLAILGFTADSLKGEDLRNLKKVAIWAPPLVSEESANHIESDFQLNPMLARGASSNVLTLQKQAVSHVLGPHIAGQKSSVKLLFVAATLLLERLRAQAGGISKMPYYFEDTEFSNGEGFALMQFLSRSLISEYISRAGHGEKFMIPAIANELKELLVFCCHRVEVVRRVSLEMAHQLISSIPAALCQHDALFALLDCLTLLDDSLKNVEDDGYSPKAVFKAKLSGVTLELGDDYGVRQRSLRELEDRARKWIHKVARTMASDLRSKLFTYLGSPFSGGFGRRLTIEILAGDNVSDDFMSQYVRLAHYNGQKKSISCNETLARLRAAKTSDELTSALDFAAPFIASDDFESLKIARESVRAPFRIFTESAISAGILFWHRIIRRQVTLRSTVVCEVVEQTIASVKQGKGLFTREHDQLLPLWTAMEYAPSNKRNLDREELLQKRQFEPHRLLLKGFIRSCMYNSVTLEPLYLPIFTRLVSELLAGLQTKASLHSVARELRLDILCFAFELLHVLQTLRPAYILAKTHAAQIQEATIKAGLTWYNQPVPQFPFGSSVQNQIRTMKLLVQIGAYLSGLKLSNEGRLYQQFIVNDHAKQAVWHEPLAGAHQLSSSITSAPHGVHVRPFGVADVQIAWEFNPHLAVHMMKWHLDNSGPEQLVGELVENHVMAVFDCAEALFYYLDKRRGRKLGHEVLYWAQLSPIDSINLLLPTYNWDQNVVQFALRSLQSHPIQVCFFYVPQIVQQLRHDESGFVEEYILEAAKFSQKFAHQIIWNIMANMYIDDDATIPNKMKPQLDRVLEHMKRSFTEEERKYYETEFGFFSSVTSISGKLKPYIKRSKAEKKVKIDEEMAKIEVPEGVYLPSHPDGTVVDIDRESGKPLQSHAKAPFLAKFKIHVDQEEFNDDDVMEMHHEEIDLWQGAIFKVGDDCRQDVLALQVISVFRSIFNFAGLDVYVFPYKVTATEAGRGIIDVLPNATSRDMLGREAVNGLNQWYHSKHGGPDSIEFQRARMNFVKSMAAYSVISWLIQFKDRHNGNIMYDDEGHCIHIDFGFCFDIVPGGVKFEAAPFKLTKEMVQVMGGSQHAAPYQWFEEQCVRTFLVSRTFADEICRIVIPMLESGLPCFKGDTIRRLRSRFALNRSEAEAAAYMRSLVSKSYESNFTKGYDEFQRITNGIPY